MLDKIPADVGIYSSHALKKMCFFFDELFSVTSFICVKSFSEVKGEKSGVLSL